MALPTNAQIDAAVPVAGTPSRSLTNAALKNVTDTLKGSAAETATPVNSSQVNAFSDAVTIPLTSVTYTGALIVGRDTVVTVIGTTGKTTSGGHIIGMQSGVILNESGTVTHDLIIGQEAQLQNPNAGTTMTLAALHVAHLKNNAGPITMLTAYRPVYAAGDNTAAISLCVDYYSENWTGLSGVPGTRFAMLNDDPSKPISSSGRFLNKTTGQELGPSPGGGYVAARYYSGNFSLGSLNPVALIANFVFFAPLRLTRRVTTTEIGITVTTLVASSNIQLALYRIVDGVLSAPLFTSSNISSATTGDKTASMSLTLDAGNYVVGVNSSHTPSVNFTPEAGLMQYFGSTTPTGRETTPTASLTFGTWGTPTLAFAEVGQSVPMIWVKGS